MDSLLLATKLQIPPTSPHLLHRDRLVDELEREIPRYKLTLISAPAGYGKTTLLAQWAHASRFPVAWLSLGEEDNDAERFFRYLLAAWERVQPGVSDSPLGMLLGAMSPDPDAVLAAFINLGSDLSGQIVFVLDDYHLIDDPVIHQSVGFLLDHLPPALHIVLAGRGEPPLALARYRARRQLLELSTDDLHFQVDETRDFLKHSTGLEVTEDALAPLQSQLEGWIAGLQLVALTLRRNPDLATATAFAGRHRYITDYLSEDVLSNLPDNTRRFLLQTSILDRLSGSLCDAVTERGSGYGQEMLEHLERENLFLLPLDENREWFRYHRVFAGVLHAELKRRHPQEVEPLHRRAAAWYLAHDQPEPAFHHALAGGDAERVQQIFEQHIYTKVKSGEFRLVQSWLDALPAEWYAAYPMLNFARIALWLFTGQVEAGVRLLADVEQQLLQTESDTARWPLARVTALRCFMACFQYDLEQAELYAGQALRELPDDDINFRSDIYGALGDTYRGKGRWLEAQRSYLKVLDYAHAPIFRVESAHLFGALADLSLRQGHLKEAAGYWRRALAAIQEPENWGRLPLPVIGWVYTRLGELLYEWNELHEAWDYIAQGLERAELGGDVRTLIAGYLNAGRLKLAEGDIEATSGYLERARPLVDEAPFPDWSSRFERMQLELWLAQGKLRAAVHWADEMLASDVLPTRPESEAAQLALARVLIVKGDTPAIERARALLRRLLQTAEAEGRSGIMIEAMALQSLADWRRGERVGAMTALERALRLAEPERYVRLFVDLGLPMARLLQEARSRGVMPDYVSRLLAAFGTPVVFGPTIRSLPEPLTEREREILKLLTAGLTNQEIAGTLSISPETVKKHTGNIYGKLGVRGRTEAAARARELDLLH